MASHMASGSGVTSFCSIISTQVKSGWRTAAHLRWNTSTKRYKVRSTEICITTNQHKQTVQYIRSVFARFADRTRSPCIVQILNFLLLAVMDWWTMRVGIGFSPTSCLPVTGLAGNKWTFLLKSIIIRSCCSSTMRVVVIALY